MDMRDKQFDNWVKDSLKVEIALTKQNRQAAWEQIRLKAAQQDLHLINDKYEPIIKPPLFQKSLYSRISLWLNNFVSQENTYHKAHAVSMHYYKSKPNYYGGLTLHRMELVRYRWICPV